MKSNKTLIMSAMLVAFVLASSFAESGERKKVTKPGSNEVVIVIRAAIDPPVDRDFYSNYKVIKSPGLDMKPDKKRKGKTPKDEVVIEFGETDKSITLDKKEFVYMRRAYMGSLGEFGYFKVEIPKNREIRLDQMQVYIDDSPVLYYKLPLHCGIAVPKGTRYVYLGNFTYTIADEFFTISGATRSDEFEAAAAVVAKQFGAKAKLERVNPIALEDTGKKK
jgi:hypothetical protein